MILHKGKQTVEKNQKDMNYEEAMEVREGAVVRE